MPQPGSAKPEGAEASLPADARNVFLEDLSKVAGPLAASTQTALAYVSSEEQRWLAADPGCACSQQPGEPRRVPERQPARARATS